MESKMIEKIHAVFDELRERDEKSKQNAQQKWIEVFELFGERGIPFIEKIKEKGSPKRIFHNYEDKLKIHNLSRGMCGITRNEFLPENTLIISWEKDDFCMLTNFETND